MKLSFAPLSLLAIVAALPIAAPVQAQTLTKAVVHFHTNDDDRPKTSIIEVAIQTTKGVVLLKGAAKPNEAWEPETDHDVALEVPAGFDKAKLAKTVFRTHYKATPDEGIKWNIHLELTFSDNSKVTEAWDKLYLTGDATHTDFEGAIYLK